MSKRSIPVAGEREIDYRPWTAAQSLNTAGAINGTARTALLVGSGAGVAVSLADGRYVGQRKTIVSTTGFNPDTVVVTPAHATGFTTITFNANAQQAELEWNGAAWFVVYTIGSPTVA